MCTASANYTEDIGEIYITTSVSNPAGEDYVAGIKRLYKGWVHNAPTFEFGFTGACACGGFSGGGSGHIHPFDFEFEGPTQYAPYVTMLYSTNNRLENARWQPGKEYVEVVEDYVSRLAGIGVVYSGWWDIGGTTYPIDKSTGATRAKELLGYDITLIQEKFQYNHQYHSWKLGDSTDTYYTSGKYLGSFDYQPIDASNVTREYAVMALYKAMRQDIVNYYLAMREDKSIHVETTPLAEIITVPVHELQLDKAWTDVFMTRSYAPAYWERAVNEHLVFGYEGSELLEYQQHIMTWGEFCELAMNFMIMYGEPTLTEEESLYILEVFGRVLPHYLQSNQLEAVKYLMARGIVSSDHNFTDEIPLDACLDILMKIFDKDSRETFKNLTLVYDPQLLADGFYPTEMSAFSHGMEFFTETDYSTATHYDYFVLITDNTRFVESKYGTAVVSGIYVSAIPGDTSKAPMKGSSYLGIISGPDGKQYYHFKIPVTLPKSTYVKEGKSAWITINTQDSSDQPHNIRIKYGGGWYGVETKRNGITYVSQSKNFSLDDPEIYVDAARKLSAQDVVDEIPLFDTSSGSYTVYIRIPEDSKDDVRFRVEGTVGGTINFDKALEDGIITQEAAKGTDMYLLKAKNLSEAKSMVLIENGADTDIFQTFSKDGNIHLVNLDFMKAIGAVTQYDWYKNKTIIFIQAYGVNVFIDTTRNVIYAGTTITEVDDTTRLWYTDSEGNLYVDYRAILGWSSGYTTITDTNGVISLDWKDNLDHTRVSATVKAAYARDKALPGGLLVDTDSGSPDVILTSTYPLANYFVYQAVSKSNTTKQDWIFVFKLRATYDEVIKDSESRALLEQFLGITVPDTWCVFSAQLERSTTRDQAIAEGKRYYFDPDHLSYQYILEDFSSAYTYTEVPKDSNLEKYGTLLPLFLHRNSPVPTDYVVYDMNLNVQSVDGVLQDYGYFPEKMLGKSSSNWIDCVPSQGNITITNPSVTVQSWNSVSTIPAPVAVATGLLGLDTIQYSDANYTWYYGTMPLRRVERSAIETWFIDKFRINAEAEGSYVGALGVMGVSEDTEYRLAYRYIGTSLYVAQVDGLDYLYDTDEEDDAPGREYGDALSKFDWENFTFYGLLTNIDDILTILTIFVLNMLPRLFMFIFMVLMALACIARFKLVINFCDKIFDPYSFLTFGRSNVHTISLFHLFITSMISLALYGLFQNGLILEIMGWLGRAVTGILNR